MRDVDNWLPPLRAGRQPAGRALLSWLDDPQAPRLCQVTGSAGTGKSHLVSWLATACVRRSEVVALSLAGQTVESATWLLAQRLGVYGATPEELAGAVAAEDRPHVLVLWDLNRADAAARIAEALLSPLLTLPQVRALVEAADGVPEVFERPAVLDLDQPGWTDAAKFGRWYGQLSADSPFPAESLGGNPWLAQLAAKVPAGTDPTGGVVAAWWSAVPDDVRPALRALAAARRPLSFREWRFLADGEAVRAACGLLPNHSAGGGTWWLPPGELRETVTAGAPAPDDAAVAAALASSLPRVADRSARITDADVEQLDLLVLHSTWSGGVAALLDDPRVLAHTDPAAISAAFASYHGGRFREVWRAAGPALVGTRGRATEEAVLRARLLGVDPGAAAALESSGSWRAEWANWLPATAPRLRAGALTQGPYTGYVMLLDASGAVRAARLADGQLMDLPANPAPAQPRSLTALPDGAVVALDAAGRPQLLAGTALPPLPGPNEAELSALGPAGAVGDTKGRVHWLPGDAAEPLHDGPVTALAGAVLTDNQIPTLVSGGLDGCVRVWLPGTPPVPEPVDHRECAVVAVSMRQSPKGLVAASGWADGLVRVYLLDRPGTVVNLRLGSPVLSVLIDGDGRIIVVLPEGLVGLAVDPEASNDFDFSQTRGFAFSPEPPSGPPHLVPGRTPPPLPLAVEDEARRRPGQWLYVFDLDRASDAVVGCWQIDHQGAPVRYLANPAYVPAPEPDAGTAVRLNAAKRLSDRDLLKALVDAELHVCATAAGGTELFRRPGLNGDYVDACTSGKLVPRHWPDTVVLTGRELYSVLPDGWLLVNPGSEASVDVPINGFHSVVD